LKINDHIKGLQALMMQDTLSGFQYGLYAQSFTAKEYNFLHISMPTVPTHSLLDNNIEVWHKEHDK